MHSIELCEHKCINSSNTTWECVDYFNKYINRTGEIRSKLAYTYSSILMTFKLEKLYSDTPLHWTPAVTYLFSELVEAIIWCKKAKELIIYINSIWPLPLECSSEIKKMRDKVNLILYSDENNIWKIIELCETLDLELETDFFTTFVMNIDKIYWNKWYQRYIDAKVNELFNNIYE